MSDLRRTIHGIVVVIAVTLTAYLVGRPRETTTAATREAHFVFIEGSVHVKRAGTFHWVDASVGFTLAENDLVSTGKKASAIIQVFDGRVVDGRALALGPDTLYTISLNQVPLPSRNYHTVETALGLLVLMALVAGLILWRIAARPNQTLRSSRLCHNPTL